MSHVVIIGAGFAGVWTAAGIVRTMEQEGAGHEPVEVTVVAPNDDMVVRPRMYERDPEQMRVSLDRVFGPIGVRRLPGVVTGVDASAHTLTVLDRQGRSSELSYDKLVLAAGSALVRPDVPGAEHLFDVDTMPAAAELDAHIAGLARRAEHEGQFTAVVVGAGFTGLEVATELPHRLAEVAGGRPVRVLLLDRGEQLAEPLGDGPRPVIAAALEKQGVEVLQGASLASLDADGVTLEDGRRIQAATVVWTAGMKASDVVSQIPGRHDALGRLEVDEFLRVEGVDDVYATGDAAAAHADADHLTMQACQHAVPLGKHAGRNVAADLLGLEPARFAPDQYVTCLDLGPGAAVYTEGWDREVKMTGDDAKKLKHQINSEWIYPPVDDRAAILDLADHHRTWPIEESTQG